MPLPSSGNITLNQMHVEAGGSSGTSCYINDSDIRALIGKGSGSTMYFSEWYGASAGLPLRYTAYGTQYNPATTGKFAGPASIYFFSSAAANIVNDMCTASNGYGFVMNDGGFFNSSTQTYGGLGYYLEITTPGGGWQYVQSSSYNFNRSHGQNSGQHYTKVYYGSTLVTTTNAQLDLNDQTGLAVGNWSGNTANIGSRTSAGSWRIEYYR